MEHAYELTIEIGAYDAKKENDIIKACMVEWNFREHDFSHYTAPDGRSVLLQASAVGIMYENEDRDEVAQRLLRAAWRVNGSPCHVEVHGMELQTMKRETLGWRNSERELHAA